MGWWPGKYFYLPYRVQIHSGLHPTTYLKRITSDFPGVKRSGYEPDHSPTSGNEVKIIEAIPPLLHIP
jgi:hypothetical protein